MFDDEKRNRIISFNRNGAQAALLALAAASAIASAEPLVSAYHSKGPTRRQEKDFLREQKAQEKRDRRANKRLASMKGKFP